jgi:hypothetical protein
MRTKALIAATALIALIPLAASAGEVENRIHDQNARIAQGVHSGSLTYGEYRSVDGRLDGIQAQRNRDLRANDGHLTGNEYAQLNREENNLSDRISFDKHNVNRQH